MIYKNFYNKYKMSQQINLEADKENIQKDIEGNNPVLDPNPIPNPDVLEEEQKSEPVIEEEE